MKLPIFIVFFLSVMLYGCWQQSCVYQCREMLSDCFFKQAADNRDKCFQITETCLRVCQSNTEKVKCEEIRP